MKNEEDSYGMMQDMVYVPQEMTIYDVQLAQAYVPMQQMCTTFTPERALKEGTAFPELAQPYLPEDGGMMYE